MELSLIDRPSKEEFAKIVASAFCVKDVVRALGYGTVNGANSATVKKRINSEQIDTSHFKHKSMKTYTDDEVFCLNTEASQSALRKRFKQGGYSAYICAICGQQPFWQNKPLTLILDHIDGNNKNGEVSNLRWVCPNCNQQLPTTGFHGVKYRNPDDIVKKPAATKVKQLNTDSRAVLRPERDKLIVEIFNSNFSVVGKQYGVSPNAVQKWLKFYGIPYTKKEFISWYYLNILHTAPPITKAKGVKAEAKPVLQYTKSGEFIRRYPSIIAASREVFNDLVHANHISAVCLNKRKSAYGYVWKFDI